MKKMTLTRRKWRYLSLILTLAMLAGLMPLNTYAAETVADAELIEPAEAGLLEDTYPAAGDDEPVLLEDQTADEADTGVLTEELVLDVEDEVISKDGEGDETNYIEVNQGLSSHTGLNDGNETLINEFVAGKQTVVMARIPGSDDFSEEQAKSAGAGYRLEAKAVTNDQEADNCELTASGENFSVKQAYDRDCNVVKGWYAVVNFPTGPDKGVYNFYIKDGEGKEVAVNKGVKFYETEALNVLVVPVNGYWSGAYSGGAPSVGAAGVKDKKFTDAQGNDRDWSDLCGVLKEYMLDVYPVKDITFEEANEIDAGNADYDMCSDAGQKKLWEEACKLQSKTKDGKDRYDLILAFVMYRQDQGAGQGYTYGKPTNIITYSDKDMLPTVAHEIAHCYQVGDEYNGGSFNNSVNYPPNGYSGRNYVTGDNITSTEGANDYWKDTKQFKVNDGGSKKNKIPDNGSGTVIPLSLHPYSLSQQKFITWAGVDEAGNATGKTVYPTMSWMGSGYSGGDGYYFTSSVIWDHLLKQFVKKEKKEESTESSSGSEEASADSAQAEITNLDIFRDTSGNADEDVNAVFSDEDDFYYDEDCRWGRSRMVEVYGWLVNGKSSVKVEMSPMFSYDGDLEYMDVIEDENLKKSNDLYTFAALGEDGKIIKSPVDGEYAATQFYGGFYNPRTKKGGMKQDEVNFNFDAEYPEGTADFAIFKGKISDIGEGGTLPGDPVWKASGDDSFPEDSFTQKPDGYLAYADVNSERAVVEWEVYYPENSEEAYNGEDKSLYTEVYYCPEGDDGKAYYVGCSEDEDWEEGYISFETDSQFDAKWTRNAYVWIKVTNGINAIDIYSDENDISLCNSKIELSKAGIRKVKADDQTQYRAECTGSPINPDTSVKVYNPADGKYISLKRDVDYTVTYENNVSVGYATVVVQGIGNYAGKNTQEFEIVKKTLAGTPGDIPDLTYSVDLDKTIRPYLSLKTSSGLALVYGTDFTVSYTVGGETKSAVKDLIEENPENRVPVTVTYAGKGNYTGECKNKMKFDVIPAGAKATSLTDASVSIELKNSLVRYTGKAVKPSIKSVTVTLSDNEIKLKKSDYKVVYSDNEDVGTGRVTIVGKKNYTGSAHTTFTIAPKQVTSISVTGLKDQPYTGSKVNVDALPITVKAGGITLRKGIDYTIEPVLSSDSVSCNYVDVTTSAMKKKGEAPKIQIRLKEADPNSKLKPRVEWGSKVKENKKTVIKDFAIKALKLDSSVVSFTTNSNKEEENIVKTADGMTAIGTMRNANKTETASKKYTFVIEGEGEYLVKNASLAEAVSIKVNGTKVDPKLYVIAVSKTANGKIGTIIVSPAKGSPYSGKRTIKFMYLKKQPSDGEQEEDDI